MRARSVLALASLAALAAAAGDPVSLKWTPKLGDTLKYRTTGEFDVAGIHAELTTVNLHKVIRVDPNGGFLIQATPVEGKATYAGTEMPVKGITTLTTYGSSGEIAEIRGDKSDATAYRMANLTEFHAPTKPVAVGDSWTAEGKGDPKTGAVAWKAEYKIDGEDKIDSFDALKMTVSARETEGSDAGTATGTMWVGKDGILVRTELDWKNLHVPGAPGNVSGKFIRNRLEQDIQPPQGVS